jgi:hypothetical protein
LLEINGITKQFNLLFSELDISPINLKNENEKTLAWSHQGNYYIARTRIDSATDKQIFVRRIILERDGKMVKDERKTFDPSSGDLIRHEITDISNGKIIQMVKTPKPGNEKEFIETKQTYVFAYHSEYRKDLDKFLWELEIQENTRFLDPLTLESALFFPDQLRLDRLDTQKLRRALEFYTAFPFYEKGSGASYVQKLVGDILRVRPFKKSVQFVEDLEKSNKES